MEEKNKVKTKDEFDEALETIDDVSIIIEEDDPQEAELISSAMLDDLIPNMVINQVKQDNDEKCIVEDEKLLDLYDEILQNARKDRSSIDEVLVNFLDMVMNGEETHTAPTEAVVNLLKIKSDIGDKMTKVADLMTRIKLKEKDTFPRYLAAHQHNNVRIESNKRDLIKNLDKKKK